MILSGSQQYFDIVTLLVRRREALGLSQGQLAQKIGRCRKTLVQWEGGHVEPSGPNLCAWSAALGVSLAPVTDP